jgi:CotH kinase protein
VSRAERALYRGRPGAWRRHIHASAAVDYVLLQELFKNQDGMEASSFMTAGRRGMLRLGPIWDFDISMGATQRRPGRYVKGWMLAHRPWASRLYADRAFARQMARRWAQLRRAGLRARLLWRVDGYAAALAPAARRDSGRWPARGERPRGARIAHVRELRRWLLRRIAWLDGNLQGLG